MKETPSHSPAMCDVLVMGGGPAGLVAALLLADSGLTVLCADPAFARLKNGAGSYRDARTIALLQGAIRMLERLDIWPDLASVATPLQTMRVEDHTGRWPPAPAMDFHAGELGDEPFGYNIPIPAIAGALAGRALHHENITLVAAGVRQVMPGSGQVRVQLDDGQRWQAPLLVAADGRHSPSRAAAGIKVVRWSYDQCAIALSFDHERSHGHVSVEFHRRPGPFTIIPMPGNRSALVWVERPQEARRLMKLDDGALAELIHRHTHDRLGQIGDIGRRDCFAVAGLTARDFAARRIALVGESGHVLPPIGAQGLNLGLRDAAQLAELVEAARAESRDIGGGHVLRPYDRRRRADIVPRTAAVDMLNRSLLSGDLAPVQAARGLGLTLLKNIPALRRQLMRQGLMPDDQLPKIMRP